MLAMHPRGPELSDGTAGWPHHDCSRFVDSGGIRFHIQEMGDKNASVALLVHGTGASTHSWRDIMPELAGSFRVVALDLPGHGFTTGSKSSQLSLPAMARAVGGLLRTMDIAPDLAIGHSAGAAVLLEMYCQGALVNASIAGLNSALEPIEGNSLLSPLAKLLFLNPVTSHFVSMQAKIGGISKSLVKATGSQIDEVGIACYRQLLQRPSHVNGAIGMMARWNLTPLQQCLSSVATDVLLVAALDDPMVPASVSRKACRMMPRAALHLEKSGGHLLHEVEPQTVAKVIVDWKRSLR